MANTQNCFQRAVLVLVLAFLAVLTGCQAPSRQTMAQQPPPAGSGILSQVPAYSGSPYVKVHSNRPYFGKEDRTKKSYQRYAALDRLGRCGTAEACLSRDTMPNGERGDISEIHPSGWQSNSGGVYNRCHLIAYQLSGQNANPRNLITGTRDMNVEGMLPFENQVADYIRATGHHVLYRVTPVFKGADLVCRGVLMEAESMEDNGTGIRFCVFCYNVQQGVNIDYATGNLAGSSESTSAPQSKKQKYVVNINTGKFHRPSCPSVQKMKPKNRKDVYATRDQMMARYEPCHNCKP